MSTNGIVALTRPSAALGARCACVCSPGTASSNEGANTNSGSHESHRRCASNHSTHPISSSVTHSHVGCHAGGRRAPTRTSGCTRRPMSVRTFKSPELRETSKHVSRGIAPNTCAALSLRSASFASTRRGRRSPSSETRVAPGFTRALPKKSASQSESHTGGRSERTAHSAACLVRPTVSPSGVSYGQWNPVCVSWSSRAVPARADVWLVDRRRCESVALMLLRSRRSTVPAIGVRLSTWSSPVLIHDTKQLVTVRWCTSRGASSKRRCTAATPASLEAAFEICWCICRVINQNPRRNCSHAIAWTLWWRSYAAWSTSSASFWASEAPMCSDSTHLRSSESMYSTNSRGVPRFTCGSARVKSRDVATATRSSRTAPVADGMHPATYSTPCSCVHIPLIAQLCIVTASAGCWRTRRSASWGDHTLPRARSHRDTVTGRSAAMELWLTQMSPLLGLYASLNSDRDSKGSVFGFSAALGIAGLMFRDVMLTVHGARSTRAASSSKGSSTFPRVRTSLLNANSRCDTTTRSWPPTTKDPRRASSAASLPVSSNAVLHATDPSITGRSAIRWRSRRLDCPAYVTVTSHVTGTEYVAASPPPNSSSGRTRDSRTTPEASTCDRRGPLPTNTFENSTVNRFPASSATSTAHRGSVITRGTSCNKNELNSCTCSPVVRPCASRHARSSFSDADALGTGARAGSVCTFPLATTRATAGAGRSALTEVGVSRTTFASRGASRSSCASRATRFRSWRSPSPF